MKLRKKIEKSLKWWKERDKDDRQALIQDSKDICAEHIQPIVIRLVESEAVIEELEELLEGEEND